MSATVHIRLELRPDGDCFAGRAISDEESREFHGWLGLMGALEALYPMPATPTTTEKGQAASEQDARPAIRTRAGCPRS